MFCMHRVIQALVLSGSVQASTSFPIKKEDSCASLCVFCSMGHRVQDPSSVAYLGLTQASHWAVQRDPPNQDLSSMPDKPALV